MKKRKKYYEAYMTVEATFIVSTAVMIIILLMYWGFYCYDKSVSVQSSYLAALRGSNEWDKSNGELDAFVTQNLDRLTEQTFLYTKKGELLVQVGPATITAGVGGKTNILFSKLRGDTMTEWDLNSEKQANRLKPTAYIRKYRLFGE